MIAYENALVHESVDNFLTALSAEVDNWYYSARSIYDITTASIDYVANPLDYHGPDYEKFFSASDFALTDQGLSHSDGLPIDIHCFHLTNPVLFLLPGL